jgi:hypothetical protein
MSWKIEGSIRRGSCAKADLIFTLRICLIAQVDDFVRAGCRSRRDGKASDD